MRIPALFLMTAPGAVLVILGPLAFVVTLALLIGSIFNVEIASAIYVAIVVMLDAIIFSADTVARTTPVRIHLSPIEAEVFRKHALYIRLPAGSSEVCVALQVTRWLSVLWIPWLLWNSLWWQAGLLAAHFAATAAISVRMNPVVPYSIAGKEGNLDFAVLAEMIESLLERYHQEV